MIAILDFYNQDPGIKIIFPEADYFIFEEEYDRTRLYEKHSINHILDQIDGNVCDLISDSKYEMLFIIAPLYNAVHKYNGVIKSDFISDKTVDYLKRTIQIINKNQFKNVCIFDNYDYDYDPNIICQDDNFNHIFNEQFVKKKQILFFKRNYSKEKTYLDNVLPFPYIIFGKQCNIDMITSPVINPPEKKCRIFFIGTLFNHSDPIYGVFRNRKSVFDDITRHVIIHFPPSMEHDKFLVEMSTSKYALDLLGVGDPNIRTFEILSSGSLRLSQRSTLKWNFEDDFCEETYFDNGDDLFNKIRMIESDPVLYQKCLDKQNAILSTYMNNSSLREYILKNISRY